MKTGKRVVALLSATVMAAGMLAGCGGSDSDSKGAEKEASAAGEAEKKMKVQAVRQVQEVFII